MGENEEGCVKPAGGPTDRSRVTEQSLGGEGTERSARMTAQVGKPAPDFEAGAYVEGTFRNIKLSDYRGRWVVLCFYPGDFTFV